MIIGGLVMALGQFALASPLGIMGTSPAWSLGSLGIAFPETATSFYVGLLLLVIGNGFFKPNISTMVGDLYKQGDARRDGAFTIFYMGINLGAFLAPLVCSTLGEDPAYGWRMGFLAAGIGMMLSVVVQLAFAQRYIGDIGREPAAARSLKLAGGTKQPLTSDERDRLRVIFVVFIFVVMFWAAFEQAGGLLNLFAEKYTDRTVGSFTVPTGWFQSLNPLFIVLLAPLFSMLWSRLGDRAAGIRRHRSRCTSACCRSHSDSYSWSSRYSRCSARADMKSEHDLAGARLSVSHDRRVVHQPGRPLDGHQARAAAPRLVDDGRLVLDQLRRPIRLRATSAHSRSTWVNTRGWCRSRRMSACALSMREFSASSVASRRS